MKFSSLQVDVSKNEEVKKKEAWESWTEVSNRFGEAEANAHLVSGRLIWREDPLTKGVWQYQDQGRVTRILSGKRGKRLRMQQDGGADSEAEDNFATTFDAQIEALLAVDLSYTPSAKGKGKGGGKGPLGKGKGKGRNQLAIEDDPEKTPRTEAELKEAALEKAKKLKALLAAGLI